MFYLNYKSLQTVYQFTIDFRKHNFINLPKTFDRGCTNIYDLQKKFVPVG